MMINYDVANSIHELVYLFMTKGDVFGFMREIMVLLRKKEH